jgi:hypothetical protein
VSSARASDRFPPEIQALWFEAGRIWERWQNTHAFRNFVAADYRRVYLALARLRPYAKTMLEWGSGLGVVTMMASYLGFDAYGVEVEPDLVEWARKLAQKHVPEARFETGSFIPEQYARKPALGDESFRTVLEAPSAYDRLNMDLADFELVYAYPWPDERTVYLDVMRQCGGRRALYLSHDLQEGIRVRCPGKRGKRRT